MLIKKKLVISQTKIPSLILITSLFLVPEIALAAGNPDAFGIVLTKMTGWVDGSAGKLITFIALIMAAVMGASGFPVRYVLGALGTGLLLSSSKTIVDMIF